MKITCTVNGVPLDSFTYEEQLTMFTHMLTDATHSIGYEFDKIESVDAVVKRILKKKGVE